MANIVNPAVIREAELFTDAGRIDAQLLADVAAMRKFALYVERRREPAEIRNDLRCTEAELRQAEYLEQARWDQLQDADQYGDRYTAATLEDFLRIAARADRLRAEIAELRAELGACRPLLVTERELAA